MWPNPQFPVDLAQKNSLMENLITEEFLNGKLPFFVQLSFIDDQVILKKNSEIILENKTEHSYFQVIF